MRPVLTSIATGKPGIIYYPIFIAEGGHITRQAKEVSGLEDTRLMGADGIFSPDFYKAAGEAAVGMFHTSPDFSAFPATYKNFLKKHQEKYGKKPEAPFHAYAYDAAMMILKAIDKVGVAGSDGSLSIDRMKLRDALYATKNYKGMTGTLTCDKYGDCADPAIAVYRTDIDNIKKGEMPTMPFWKP
jgi:branched-chain amino acid transport system substrate-binding protein